MLHKNKPFHPYSLIMLLVYITLEKMSDTVWKPKSNINRQNWNPENCCSSCGIIQRNKIKPNCPGFATIVRNSCSFQHSYDIFAKLKVWREVKV